mgnify:CR=1 FL=1
MATIQFRGIEKYQAAIKKLGTKTEAMCKYAIYDPAGMLLEEIKRATPIDTGDLRDSLCTTPMKNKDGFIYEQLDFSGYDRKGVPNKLKARSIESGTRTIRKHPFVRPTVRRFKKLAEFMMEKAIDEYLAQFMKKES